MAGGAFVCLLPSAVPAQEAEGLPLQLSQVLGATAGPPPRFREDGGPDPRLIASGGVGMTPFDPKAAPRPNLPAGPGEFPLRLAQVMVPQAGNGRQPRWSNRPDPGLDLQPAPFLGLPGAPGQGPMPGLPGQGLAPALPGQGPAPRFPGQDAVQPLPPRMDAGQAPGLGRGAFPSSDLPPAAAEQESAGNGIMGWAIPPIRWGGTLGYNLRRGSNSDGARSLDQVFNANLRAASYIYAPWLASVSGSLGVVAGINRSSSGGGGQEVQTRSASVVGGANLDLFPSSRFPFNANLTRSDSRVITTALANDYTETRLGLRQSYRSEDSLQNAAAGFDHSVVTAQAGTRDTVSALNGSFSTLLWGINNSANARASVSQREGTGEGSRLFGFNSTHTYSADENLSLQAYSSYTDNELRYSTAGTINQFRGQFLQLGTTATWRPEFEDEEDYPLTLTGGLAYSDTRMGGTVIASQVQRVTGTTSAYYRFSPNLTANGTGTVNYVTGTTGPAQFLGLVNASVAYTGDPLTIGKYSYNWNTGANGSWQGGSGNLPSNMLAGVQAGHSLGRNFIISEVDSLSLTLSQTGALYQNQMAGNSSTLMNSAMASYRLGLGERFSGSVTGGYSDTLATGVNAQRYQSLSLGFNGFGQINSRSSANVNLMFNWSDQNQKSLLSGSNQASSNQRMAVNGNASYTHTRFANVPGLRYTFLFAADSLLRDNRLLGDPNAQAQRYRYSVDNRLDYRIGLLDLRLSALVTEAGGKKNALLFFQVTRQIGSF